MYAYFWRRLPAPKWAKVAIFAVAAALVLAVCFVWVFPAVLSVLQGPTTVTGAGALNLLGRTPGQV